MSGGGEKRHGGGKRRSGAAALLRSVSLFFTVRQRALGGRSDKSSARTAGKEMKPKETKGPAKLVESLRKQTHFSRQEVESLCSLYQKLLSSAAEQDLSKLEQGQGQGPLHALGPAPPTNLGAQRKQGLDRIVFRDLLHNTFGVVTEEVLMDRIFCAFDTECDGVIRLEEWVCGLSVFLKGTLDETTAFAFSVYDLNNDGYILREEMFHLLRNSLVKQPQDEDPDEGVKDLVELVLKKLDADLDGKISYEDFRSAVEKEPLFLEAFGQCLPTDAAARAFLTTLAV